MVYYGPWQESRVHEELIVLKTSDDDNRTVSLFGESPTVRSGWDANILAALGWSSVATGTGEIFQDINNPPPAQLSLSLAGFLAAFDQDVSQSLAGSLQHHMVQAGEQNYLSPPGRWRQDQQWDLSGVGYRLWFNAALNNQTGNPAYAVPPGMDTFADDYYVELETLGAARPVELIEATLLSGSGGLGYRLYVKDAHPTTAGAFLRSATTGSVPGAASSLNEARNYPAVSESYPLAHDTLNALAKDGTPDLGDWSLDGRMPTFSVIYDGPNLSNATLGGEIGFEETAQGVRAEVRLRYRWPRWRQVFYEVPYRRITQRADGLAGGARRTHPTPKTIQGSNRRGAGSIV